MIFSKEKNDGLIFALPCPSSGNMLKAVKTNMTSAGLKGEFDTLLICDHVLLNRSEAEAVQADILQTDRKTASRGQNKALSKTAPALPNRRENTKSGAAPLSPGRFYVANNKAVGVIGGRIAFVGPVEERLKAKKTYRFKNHLLSPGFINTHTHLPMSLFRGLAEDLPLKDWLENYIFPLESRFVNEDFISVGTPSFRLGAD